MQRMMDNVRMRTIQEATQPVDQAIYNECSFLFILPLYTIAIISAGPTIYLSICG